MGLHLHLMARNVIFAEGKCWLNKKLPQMKLLIFMQTIASYFWSTPFPK